MATVQNLTIPEPPSGASVWALARRRMFSSRMTVVCTAILGIIVLVCVLAPWIAPYSYQQIDLKLGATPPSRAHWMGTDTLGRDLFSRCLYGGQISIAVGIVGTLVSLIVGVLYGAIAGYAGGRTDELMMRFVDFLYSLPFLFLVIILLVFFSSSILMLFVALGLVQWLTMARIVRGQVLSLKNAEFVQAARLAGTRAPGLFFRHLLPNVLNSVIVYGTLTVPTVILQEAFLSFLGLGVQPPRSSWGTLISDGANVMGLFPWLVFFPSLMLAAVLFSFNFVGDGLRDALDPRLNVQ
ncbi:MAG: ABC transporter permease [Acidobacteria bacterium]|nr:ABC transporter permease [Acidobacteriota bacterium]